MKIEKKKIIKMAVGSISMTGLHDLSLYTDTLFNFFSILILLGVLDHNNERWGVDLK